MCSNLKTQNKCKKIKREKKKSKKGNNLEVGLVERVGVADECWLQTNRKERDDGTLSFP